MTDRSRTTSRPRAASRGKRRRARPRRTGQAVPPHRSRGWSAWRSSSSVVVVAILGPGSSTRTRSTRRQRPATPNSPPSPGYPLGHGPLRPLGPVADDLGPAISLIVGLAAAVGPSSSGPASGLVRLLRRVATRPSSCAFTDWFLVIPFLPLAIVLSVILGPSLFTVIVVIAITSWPSTARLIRAQVLSLKTRPYVERARALGAERLAPRHPPHPAERGPARSSRTPS